MIYLDGFHSVKKGIKGKKAAQVLRNAAHPTPYDPPPSPPIPIPMSPWTFLAALPCDFAT